MGPKMKSNKIPHKNHVLFHVTRWHKLAYKKKSTIKIYDKNQLKIYDTIGKICLPSSNEIPCVSTRTHDKICLRRTLNSSEQQHKRNAEFTSIYVPITLSASYTPQCNNITLSINSHNVQIKSRRMCCNVRLQ